MAIFHCAVSHGSRKDGQSGAAKVDYIMRCGNYSRDPGEVIGACAGHLPSWADGNPRVFFEAVDKYERSNGRLFTQVIFAIPNELSDEDALLLAYHFAEAVTENGAPYVLAVHRGGVEVPDVESAAAAPEEADEEDLPPHNRHGHLLMCERIDDGIERTAKEWFRRANKKEPALGGAAKDREMNGGNWVPEVRHLCADYVNYGLKRAGFSERVTCESHETRIARAEAAGDEETAERLRLNPPGIHLGPTAWAIEQGRPARPGRPSWRGDLNRLIAAEGEELRGKVEALNAQLGQLDVREAAVNEKLEAARRVAAAQFEQREEALRRTSIGKEILHAVRAEMIGESAAPPSVVQLGEMLEVAEERFGAALDLREAGFRETSVGSQYLADAASSVVGKEGSPTLYQREAIITTVETRLGQELDAREALLQESADGAKLLLEVQHEHAEEYGPTSKLAQREQLIAAAEQQLRARADAERAAQRDLDVREEALRSLSIGSELLAAAEQELLGQGKRSGTLSAARAAVVGRAERRADEALEGREEALRSRSLGERDGEPTAPAIDGAWLYASKFAEPKAGRRQRGGLLDRGGREQALVWAEQQMDRLDALHEAEALYPFFGKLFELGPSRRPTDIEQSLDYAEEQQRAAAERRQDRVDALSGAERVFFEEKLDALDPQRRETGTPKPTHVDAAVDYARARVVALDEEIEGRRAVIEQTPGDGHARLLAAGFGEASRQQKIEALSVMETDLAEDFARREKRIRSDGAGAEFLPRGRRAVLGDARRQPETLPERGRVIVAAEAYQRHAVQRRRAEGERRETRHQSISDTPGGAARLGAAGWDEARTDSERDQVLAIVERDLAADFERREEALRSDETGEALLRRGRLEVLEADREASTLAERGRIIERAEALRQKAEVEQRQAAAKKRSARIEKLFAVEGGDEVFFTALDARKPAWRETGTDPADIDDALDVAEPQVERTKHQRVSAEHELTVEAEETFPDMSSAACRQAGGKFADTATHARTVSQRLSDRAQARSLAAERAEPPASADLVLRLFEWLRVQIEKLLDRLLPAVRKTPQVLLPVRRQPAVLPPVRRALEVLPPVRRRPEVLPPPTRQPQVLPPVQRAPEILPPVRRQPEVLMPVRQKPRVRTPQPDPIARIVGRAEEQYPDASSSTWWKVKHQLFELHETLEGQKARAAADKLSSHARRRDGFRIPPPPPAGLDSIEAIPKWLRECAREEIERLGLHRGPVPVPPRSASAQTPKRNVRGPERTPGGGYVPGR